MPQETTPDENATREEKAKKKIGVLYASITKVKGILPGDSSTLDQNFWNKWQETFMPKGSIPEDWRKKRAAEFHEVLYNLDPKSETLKQFRNFFRLPTDHPTLLPQDIQALLEGKPTIWQEDKNRARRAQENAYARNARNQREAPDQARRAEQNARDKTQTPRGNAQTESERKYNAETKKLWENFWIGIVKSINTGETVENIRNQVLARGIIMISLLSYKEFPLDTIKDAGEQLVSNLLETPVDHLKRTYNSTSPKIPIPQSNGRGQLKPQEESVNNAIFQRILEESQRYGNDQKTKLQKLRRHMMAAFYQGEHKTTKNQRDQVREDLFKYTNGGYDKYISPLVNIL